MKKYFKYWLLIVLILQPILDIVAYFTYEKISMFSFTLRSLISFFIVLYTFIKSSNKKKYIICIIPIAVYAMIHLLNSYRIGIIDPFREIRYIVSVISMPVLSIALIDYVKDRREYIDQIKLAMVINLFVIFISVVLSVVTNTYSTTYTLESLGVTGWFSSANTQSMVLVALSPLFMYYASKSDNDYVYIISHLIIFFLLFLNGTKACFFTLIITYIVMLYICISNKETKNRNMRITITSIFIVAFILSINYSFAYARREDVLSNENRIKSLIPPEYASVDLKTLPKDVIISILNNHEYWSEMIEYFGEDRIYNEMYNHLHIEELSNNRLRKKIYGKILFEDSDLLTKLVGIRYSSYSSYPVVDMENDLTAIFYYYGYIGFTLYMIFIAYFAYLLLKEFAKDKKVIFDGEFVFLCVTLLLLVFGSEYTGAFLRKPNANIYMALVLTLIYMKSLFDDKKIEANDKVSGKKKITFLLLHLGFGGVENAATSLANNLCDTYDIELVSVYKLYDKPAYKLNNKIKITYLIDSDIAIKVDEYKKLLKKGKIFKLSKLLFKNYKLNIFKLIYDTGCSIKTVIEKNTLIIDYIKNMKTDIVLSTRTEYNYYVSKYAKDCYKVAWEHNHGDIKHIKDVIDSCYNIDSLVLVSKELYNLYNENNTNNNLKLYHVPNVLDNMPTKVSKLNNNKIVSVGRLVEIKGYDDMIDVMKIVHEKNKDITLEIIGDGDLYDHLNQKIEDNNLEDIVRLVGFKDKTYINNALYNSSLFLSTSHSESFGIVVIEAMASGVPTIAFSSAEGLRELIDKDNGVLIENRNINEMADKIIEVFNDRKSLKSMGKSSYNKSLNYTGDKVYNLWMKVMNNENE